jgi:hypothetical protein
MMRAGAQRLPESQRGRAIATGRAFDGGDRQDRGSSEQSSDQNCGHDQKSLSAEGASVLNAVDCLWISWGYLERFPLIRFMFSFCSKCKRKSDRRAGRGRFAFSGDPGGLHLGLDLQRRFA